MESTQKAPRRSRKTKLTAGVTAVVLAGSLGAVALFDNAGAAPGDNAKYTITLTGAAQVPPTSDARTGTAVVQVKGPKARVCVVIKKVGPNNKTSPAPGEVPIAAHIHGPANSAANAPILIPLTAPTLKGKYYKSKTCVDGVDPALITALKTTPNLYYVNVHTVDFPGGSLRGQLAP